MKVTQPPEGTHQGDSMCCSVAPGVQGQGFQEGEGHFWPSGSILVRGHPPQTYLHRVFGHQAGISLHRGMARP